MIKKMVVFSPKKSGSYSWDWGTILFLVKPWKTWAWEALRAQNLDVNGRLPCEKLETRRRCRKSKRFPRSSSERRHEEQRRVRAVKSAASLSAGGPGGRPSTARFNLQRRRASVSPESPPAPEVVLGGRPWPLTSPRRSAGINKEFPYRNQLSSSGRFTAAESGSLKFNSQRRKEEKFNLSEGSLKRGRSQSRDPERHIH